MPGRGTVIIRAVDRVDLSIAQGEAYGLVGESGSGKTTLARCLLRLVDATAGRIEVAGRDVTAASGCQLRALRREMQVVFQDPVGSLDPRARVVGCRRGAAADPSQAQLPGDRGACRRAAG